MTIVPYCYTVMWTPCSCWAQTGSVPSWHFSMIFRLWNAFDKNTFPGLINDHVIFVGHLVVISSTQCCQLHVLCCPNFIKSILVLCRLLKYLRRFVSMIHPVKKLSKMFHQDVFDVKEEVKTLRGIREGWSLFDLFNIPWKTRNEPLETQQNGIEGGDPRQSWQSSKT